MQAMTHTPRGSQPRGPKALMALTFGLTLGLSLGACDKPEAPSQAASAATDGSPQIKSIVAPTTTGPQDNKLDKPTGDQSERVVFNLVDNRHMAHLYSPGLWIFPGQASALKYVQGRWKNPWYDAEASEDGAQRFAYVKGVGATVRAPLGWAGQSGKSDETWIMRAKIKPAGAQRCDVFLSPADGPEQKIGSWAFEADTWSEQEVALPKGLELGQDVSLRFHFSKSQSVGEKKSAAAFEHIYLGPKAQDLKAPAQPFDAAKDTITLAPGQSLTWHLMPAKGATLRAKADAAIKVHVQAHGEEAKALTLDASSPTASLEAWAHKPTRLTLSASDKPINLSDAGIIVPTAPLAPAGKPPKVIVVWLIDTLRADHLKMYNPNSDVQTPNLDALAKASAVFERASVQGNSSLPSSASIFSASYPSVHKIVTEKAKLSQDQTLLGEAFKQAKWRTGLFSSNGYVSQSWGFARGFDKEVNPIREGTPSKAEYLWPAAKGWLQQQLKASKDEPILLYLNTSDPHVPYDPPTEDLKLYHQGGAVGKVTPRGTGQLLHDMAEGKVKLSGPEVAYMRALYKGAITYNDRWFGTMLKDLEALGVRDEAMIVVTSDHGEEFGEHERFGHGISLYQELIDVPLMLHYKPWTSQGVRVEEAVELIDLYPTLIAALGGELAPSVQGQALDGWIRSAQAQAPSTSFSYHNDFLISARVHDWKYLLFQGDKDPVHQLKYTDLSKVNAAKPASIEGPDVRSSAPIARRMMRDLMAFHVRYDQSWSKRTDGLPNNHSEALAKRLDAQGW